MIRLFVALEIPEFVKDQLFDVRRKIFDDEINFRWEPKNKIHITLKFIGDVKEEILSEIENDLLFLKTFNKIKCEINNFGFFFRDGIPRILWSSLALDHSVNEIVLKLNVEFLKYGIEKERRNFKPHLTLLRLKKNPGADFINSFNNYDFEPLKFETDKIVLYRSELHKNGSKYFEVKTYHLN